MKRNLILVFLLSICATTIHAEQTDLTFRLSTGEFRGSNRIGDAGEAETDFDRATGFGVSVNHFWTPRFSTELSLFRVGSDASLRAEGVPSLDAGELDITPIGLAGQFHFAREARLSPYIGAGLAWVQTGDVSSSELESAGIGRVNLGNEIAPIALAGLSLNLTPKLAIALDARFISLEAEARVEGDQDRFDIEIDPLLISLGLRWRF